MSTVAGMVVKLAGSVPLKSATVRLRSVEDRTRTFSSVTDVGGRFEIKGIPPGNYRLRVFRNGFVTQEYGQRTPDDPGIVLSLSPGRDLKDLLFRLIPWTVISGRIQNEEGDPLPWVRVTALRESFERGKRKLSSEVTVITNDLGEYRLFGLRPGRYFIRAKPGPRLDEEHSDDQEAPETEKPGYVTTYYPGTPDPAKASLIPVESGEDLSSIDMLLEPVTVFSVRGRVINMTARYSNSAPIVGLEARSTGLAWSMPAQQLTVENPDGSFEFHNVLPGSYTLTATWFDQNNRRYQARQSIEVVNIDVEAAQLVLAPSLLIPGQIIWDPKPSMERDPLMVSISGADSTFVFGAQARVSANGSFYLQNVSEGLYRLSTSGQSPDCYLKSIHYSGTETPDDEFNVIRAIQQSLTVTISCRGARIHGTVKDSDGLPAAGVWVVLVPDEAHRNEYRRYKAQTTDQYGRFDLRGVAPGDCKLFSWEQVERNAWEDPEFVRLFEGKGESVSVQESEAKSVDLVAIPSSSRSQEKQ